MQKLETIEIRNFKSIRDAKIDDCRRVNIFIGYPNVGKSNILEAIGMLAYIPENREALKLKGLVRHEKLSQFFNYFNIENPAVIKLDRNYELKISYKDEKLLRLNLYKENEVYPNFYPEHMRVLVGNESISSSSTNNKDDLSGRFHELQDLRVKPYKFSDDKIYNESYSALKLKVPFGRNLFELIVNNKKIQNEFSELLRPYNLELVIDVSNNDVKVSPPIKDGIIKTMPISLIAETIIRLIFFKSAIISNRNSVLLFEEPESHMFPPYIGKLTSDIIFDKNQNQYFIATHSPFVLNDFIEDMDRADLSIYVVGFKNEETVIRRLSDEEVSEASMYGVDLFFNLESYLKDGTISNA